MPSDRRTVTIHIEDLPAGILRAVDLLVALYEDAGLDVPEDLHDPETEAARLAAALRAQGARQIHKWER